MPINFPERIIIPWNEAYDGDETIVDRMLFNHVSGLKAGDKYKISYDITGTITSRFSYILGTSTNTRIVGPSTTRRIRDLSLLQAFGTDNFSINQPSTDKTLEKTFTAGQFLTADVRGLAQGLWGMPFTALFNWTATRVNDDATHTGTVRAQWYGRQIEIIGAFLSPIDNRTFRYDFSVASDDSHICWRIVTSDPFMNLTDVDKISAFDLPAGVTLNGLRFVEQDGKKQPRLTPVTSNQFFTEPLPTYRTVDGQRTTVNNTVLNLGRTAYGKVELQSVDPDNSTIHTGSLLWGIIGYTKPANVTIRQIAQRLVVRGANFDVHFGPPGVDAGIFYVADLPFVSPSASESSTPSMSSTPTPSLSESNTPTPSLSESSTPSRSESSTPSRSESNSATPSLSESASLSESNSATPSPSPSPGLPGIISNFSMELSGDFITFSWDPAPNAERYSIGAQRYVGGRYDGNFSTAVFGGRTTARIRLGLGLTRGRDYRIYITARNNLGRGPIFYTLISIPASGDDVMFISASASATPSITPSLSESNSATPSLSESPTPSLSESNTPTPSLSESNTPSLSESNTPTPSLSESNTPTPTPTVSVGSIYPNAPTNLMEESDSSEVRFTWSPLGGVEGYRVSILNSSGIKISDRTVRSNSILYDVGRGSISSNRRLEAERIYIIEIRGDQRISDFRDRLSDPLVGTFITSSRRGARFVSSTPTATATRTPTPTPSPSHSSTPSLSMGLPAPVTNVRARWSRNSIELRWDQFPRTVITWVYATTNLTVADNDRSNVSLLSDGWVQVGGNNRAGNFFALSSNLIPNTTYRFRVCGRNSLGEGPCGFAVFTLSDSGGGSQVSFSPSLSESASLSESSSITPSLSESSSITPSLSESSTPSISAGTILDPVTNLNINFTDTGIVFTWDAVSGADHYVVIIEAYHYRNGDNLLRGSVFEPRWEISYVILQQSSIVRGNLYQIFVRPISRNSLIINPAVRRPFSYPASGNGMFISYSATPTPSPPSD